MSPTKPRPEAPHLHIFKIPPGVESLQFASLKSYRARFHVYFLRQLSTFPSWYTIYCRNTKMLARGMSGRLQSITPPAAGLSAPAAQNSAQPSLGNLQGLRSHNPPRHPLPAARPRQDEGRPARPPPEAESRAAMAGLPWRLCNLLMAAFFGLAAVVQVRAAGGTPSQAAAELGLAALARSGAAPAPRTPLSSASRPPSPARPARRLQGLRVRFLAAGERSRRWAVGGEYGLEPRGAERGALALG